MKRVVEASSLFEANELRARLEAQGIDAFVFGGETFSTPGVNPLAFPSVWVANDADAERAQSLVARYLAERAVMSRRAPWTCACGERHEGQFEVCWRCGAARGD